MVVPPTGLPRKHLVPMRSGRARRGARAWREHGQATVETVALLPIYGLVALAMGQGAVAGYTAWSAAGAARVGARAQALGADPVPAVRRELPAMLLPHARVWVAAAGGERAGQVTVRLHVPSIVPGLRFGTVDGLAQLPNQVGT